MAVLNDEQAMLKDMAVDWARERAPVTAMRALYEGAFAQGHDPELYAEMAQMGWTGIIVSEAQGGSDFGYLSLGLIIEELGRTLAASPLLSSALVAASALRIAGSDAQKDRWLPEIADGSVIGALAVDEGARHAPDAIALAAEKSGEGWVLNGIKRPVQDGMAAQLLIVAAKAGDDILLFAVPVDAAGVTREALVQVDMRSPALIRFTDVAVGADAVLTGGAKALDAILDRARIGVAAEMLGTAAQAFHIILDYLKTRMQFGQLIGSFQALQHRAAAMFGELQLTRSAVEAALAAIDADDADLPALASLAKALAGETLYLISNEMVQMHGGIGMTHEHDAGLYLKRARVADQMYGNVAFHRERWGRLNGY